MSGFDPKTFDPAKPIKVTQAQLKDKTQRQIIIKKLQAGAQTLDLSDCQPKKSHWKLFEETFKQTRGTLQQIMTPNGLLTIGPGDEEQGEDDNDDANDANYVTPENKDEENGLSTRGRKALICALEDSPPLTSLVLGPFRSSHSKPKDTEDLFKALASCSQLTDLSVDCQLAITKGWVNKGKAEDSDPSKMPANNKALLTAIFNLLEPTASNTPKLKKLIINNLQLDTDSAFLLIDILNSNSLEILTLTNLTFVADNTNQASISKAKQAIQSLAEALSKNKAEITLTVSEPAVTFTQQDKSKPALQFKEKITAAIPQQTKKTQKTVPPPETAESSTPAQPPQPTVTTTTSPPVVTNTSATTTATTTTTSVSGFNYGAAGGAQVKSFVFTRTTPSSSAAPVTSTVTTTTTTTATPPTPAAPPAPATVSPATTTAATTADTSDEAKSAMIIKLEDDSKTDNNKTEKELNAKVETLKKAVKEKVAVKNIIHLVYEIALKAIEYQNTKADKSKDFNARAGIQLVAQEMAKLMNAIYTTTPDCDTFTSGANLGTHNIKTTDALNDAKNFIDHILKYPEFSQGKGLLGQKAHVATVFSTVTQELAARISHLDSLFDKKTGVASEKEYSKTAKQTCDAAIEALRQQQTATAESSSPQAGGAKTGGKLSTWFDKRRGTAGGGPLAASSASASSSSSSPSNSSGSRSSVVMSGGHPANTSSSASSTASSASSPSISSGSSGSSMSGPVATASGSGSGAPTLQKTS